MPRTKERTVPVTHLAGIGELADVLTALAGRPIGKTNVTTWINRRESQKNGFPEPLAQLACGGIYDVTEVINWYTAGRGRA